MKMNQNYFKIILILTLLSGCGGSHGAFEVYLFQQTNDEIVLMVDQFLLENPEYLDHIDSISGYSWIHIKIPKSKNRYGFRIGGNSEIGLITAGKNNEISTFGHNYWFFQRNAFKEDFKKNFIDLLDPNKIPNYKIVREPFILTMNKEIDTIMWPKYFIYTDTNLVFPFPKEFDTLSIDYFYDLFKTYSSSINKELYFNQYKKYFRINEQLTGYLDDSIRITRYYRRIGQNFRLSTCFNTNEWIQLTDSSNTSFRLNNYSKIRKERLDNNYKKTDVFSEFSIELWMENEKIREDNTLLH